MLLCLCVISTASSYLSLSCTGLFGVPGDPFVSVTLHDPSFRFSRTSHYFSPSGVTRCHIILMPTGFVLCCCFWPSGFSCFIVKWFDLSNYSCLIPQLLGWGESPQLLVIWLLSRLFSLAMSSLLVYIGCAKPGCWFCHTSNDSFHGHSVSTAQSLQGHFLTLVFVDSLVTFLANVKHWSYVHSPHPF